MDKIKKSWIRCWPRSEIIKNPQRLSNEELEYYLEYYKKYNKSFYQEYHKRADARMDDERLSELNDNVILMIELEIKKRKRVIR